MILYIVVCAVVYLDCVILSGVAAIYRNIYIFFCWLSVMLHVGGFRDTPQNLADNEKYTVCLDGKVCVF